jgi:hypothetical protein
MIINTITPITLDISTSDGFKAKPIDCAHPIGLL